jgi:hypothetical protein
VRRGLRARVGDKARGVTDEEHGSIVTVLLGVERLGDVAVVDQGANVFVVALVARRQAQQVARRPGDVVGGDAQRGVAAVATRLALGQGGVAIDVGGHGPAVAQRDVQAVPRGDLPVGDLLGVVHPPDLGVTAEAVAVVESPDQALGVGTVELRPRALGDRTGPTAEAGEDLGSATGLGRQR